MKRASATLFLLFSVTLQAATLGTSDPSGARFLKDGTVLCPGLRKGCALRHQSGESIPPEATEAIFIVRSEKELKVAGPSDLAGCVSIGSPYEALEYVRFFSSYGTVHLFADAIMEVYMTPGKVRSEEPATLPQTVWKLFHLPAAAATRTAEGYRVTRVVAVPVDGKPWHIRLKKLVQSVTRSGEVEEISRVDCGVPAAELEGLSFPMFL